MRRFLGSASRLAPTGVVSRLALRRKRSPVLQLAHGKNRKNVERIISATSRVLEQHGREWAQKPDGNPAPSPGTDIEDRLQRLADLQAKGLISDDEYAKRRAEILGEI